MTEPTTSLADTVPTPQAPSVYELAHAAAEKAFKDAYVVEDQARQAFSKVGNDQPMAVYTEALGRFQRASERVKLCSAALSALEKATANTAAEAAR